MVQPSDSGLTGSSRDVSDAVPAELLAFLDRYDIQVGDRPPSQDAAEGPTRELATELDALHECDVCRRAILDVPSAVEALVERFKASHEAMPLLEERVRELGLELGDTLSPNYCSSHAQITSE